jgi:hypothetical protein
MARALEWMPAPDQLVLLVLILQALPSGTPRASGSKLAGVPHRRLQLVMDHVPLMVLAMVSQWMLDMHRAPWPAPAVALRLQHITLEASPLANALQIQTAATPAPKLDEWRSLEDFAI